MPRPSTRSTRSINHRPLLSPPPPQPPTPEEETYLANLTLLRRNWKWAVFSQFYFTFAPLFAMHDIPISVSKPSASSPILANQQPLIFTLGYRRRPCSLHSRTHPACHVQVTLCTYPRQEDHVRKSILLPHDHLTPSFRTDNWQSSLRRQYARRDPSSNPIGFEPKKVNQKYILEPEDPQQSASVSVEPEQTDSRAPSEYKAHHRPKDELDDDSPPVAGLASDLEASELREWHDLPIISKLNSMNLLIEWMFHNPHRIRSIMRDDDETAQWVSLPFQAHEHHHDTQHTPAHRTYWIRR